MMRLLTYKDAVKQMENSEILKKMKAVYIYVHGVKVSAYYFTARGNILAFYIHRETLSPLLRTLEKQGIVKDFMHWTNWNRFMVETAGATSYFDSIGEGIYPLPFSNKHVSITGYDLQDYLSSFSGDE